MKPNDENGWLPPAERPFRILVIAGSDRRQYNCPGVDSKARALMLRMADLLPQGWEVDLRMKVGIPPPGSSVAAQQRLGLNDDASFSATRGEGEKLRD